MFYRTGASATGPMPEDALSEALKLAKIPRGQGGNPFARKVNGRFDIRNMTEREATLAAVHDLYNAEFGKYDDPQPVVAKRPEEYLEQPGRISVNILKLYVDTLSVNYDNPPQRVYYRNGERVGADDPVLSALNKQLAGADYDRFMGQLDRWMRLFGNVVVRPFWDADNKQLTFQMYPSYCVRVVENAKNPRIPLATVLIGGAYAMNPDGSTEVTQTAEVWAGDAFQQVEVKAGGKGTTEGTPVSISAAEYNYNFPPLVHCFDSPPFGGSGRYYVHSIGWPLAQQNQRLNEDYFSQYIYAALMQAIGITVVKGAFAGELVFSPGRAIHFPNGEDGSGIQSVAQNASLADFQAAIQFMLDVIRESYGIPASLLNAEVSSSGQAIIQASAPLAELRGHRQPLFNKIETDLLRATIQELRGRAEGFAIGLDPMEWEVALNYPDPRASLSVTDQIAKDKHLMSVGAITAAEIAMRENPGQFDSLEEAKAATETNKPEVMPGEPDNDESLEGTVKES